MLEDSSAVLVVGELPIEQRSGQIDLTFSIRREIPGRTVLTPVMILELKSKTGLGFNLYGVQTRNKKKKDYVPKFHAWKRRLTDDEWKLISNSKTSKDVKDQLNAYEKRLLHEYRRLVPSDPTPPDSLWKGVVVLDTDQSPLEVYDAFQDLLTDIKIALANDVIDSSILTTYTPAPTDSQRPPRLTLLLSLSDGPSYLNSEAITYTNPIMEEDPFRERVSDERILTLYVSIPSTTSSGNVAAWISRNWHLLHHLEECERTTSKKTEMIWLDLMGVFKSLESEEDEDIKHQLIRTRFGLDELIMNKRISRWTHKRLVSLVERVSFVDLSHEIDQLVETNNSDLSSLLDTLKQVCDVESNSERIIVIDGWSEFRELIPKKTKHIVRYLERFLLDVLPKDNTNIIWIDSGVSHTRMNPRYQRKCIRPLSHDSNRKQHLDEIIYNVPSSPNSFGLLTPRREDIRTIIQDTPTSAQPWLRTIDVPLLRDFTRIVRGATRRDGIVPVDEVVRPTNLEPMYNRGVTLSGIVACMSHLNEEMIEEIEGDSMTLVPSVLRPRSDETVKEEKETKTISTIIEKIVSPPRAPTLTERMILCPEQTPPHFSRNRYYDAKTITRGWCYDSFPSEPEEQDGLVRRPPLTVPTESSEIDTELSKELELRRLLYAAEFLMKRVPEYEDLYQVCEETARICTDALKGEKNEENHLISLRNVRKIILRRSRMNTLWNELVSVRSEIITLLNSENRNSLEETMERNPDVLEMYGNNLFLTICAVVGELVPVEHHNSAVCQLWSAVAEWIPYQLGFKTQNDVVQTKYDLQAIHSNLRYRTRILLDMSFPAQEPVMEEWGQFLWTEVDDLYKVWVILRDDKETVGGLFTALPQPVLYPRWYRCVTDSNEQRSASRQSIEQRNRIPLITQQYGEKTLLWILIEDEEEERTWVPFLLEYPNHHHRKSNLLPWLKLSEVPIQTLSELQPPKSTDLPPHVESNVDRFLESVSTKTGDPIKVTCHVSVDLEQELYRIDFYHKNKIVETRLCSETIKLVRTLRHPIRAGSGLETSSGILLTWDHKSDVEYQDVSVEKDSGKETISLTLLKPFVHRSRFYPKEYSIPKTCSELLSTEEGEPLTLVIQSEDSRFKYLNVRFDGVPADSSLRTLETVSMSIYDIALLTECEQLIDTETSTRHSINLDAKELYDLKFRKLSEYSRLQSAIAGLVISDYDWTKDSWIVSIDTRQQQKNEIRWWIQSARSGKTWQNKSFDYVMDYALSIDEVINDFEAAVGQTIPLKHLSGFSDLIAGLKRTLRARGWKKGRPRCRIDLETRRGQYVAVVCRLESVGETSEITSFPVDVRIDEEVLSRELEGEWGPLSNYDIVNLEEFYESVSIASPELGIEEADDNEPDEETELLQAIGDWREEENHPYAKRFLGESLAKLAQLRLSQDRISNALNAAEEALSLLRECDLHSSNVRLSLSRVLATKADVFLRDKRDYHEVEIYLREARELVHSLRTDITVQKVSEWIDKLMIRKEQVSELLKEQKT